MRISRTSVFTGPNRWAYFPVIRLTLHLRDLEGYPTGLLGPSFQQALLDALPGLRAHRCSFGVPGGFVRRMTEGEGTWLGHVLEHTAIELQNVAGYPVSFGRARAVADRVGIYDVVYEYQDREVGLAAGRLALDLLNTLLPAALRPPGARPAFEWPAARASFLELAADRRLGPSTAALVREAERRRIPWERLDGDHLIQFGYGVRQQRVQGSITSRTSQLGVEIAQDKGLTNRVLGALGIPVPAQVRVSDANEAVAAAEALGYPVVVKPLDGNHGRGVVPDIQTAEQVAAAFSAARDEGRGVLVEKHIEGMDHRLLVVGGELVAAARRIPAQVVGDGEHTIEQLVWRANADPRRGDGHGNVLTRIALDAEADRMLARVGRDRGSVPRNGEVVVLRATANLSRGGTSSDVTDRVHPDNRLLAIRAAAAVGLDVAGVDLLIPDIARSHLEVGGAVCEVNAAPGLRMHIAPVEGAARDVARPIMEQLFPPGRPHGIPIAAITGTNGKTTTAAMVAHIAERAGHKVGLTTTNGVYVGGSLIEPGDASGPASARMVLRDPTVDCAVFETARGGILRRGLAFRRCTVGAVLNVTADHLGLGGIDTVEELAEAKRIVVEVATDAAVLNADDPLCVAMMPHVSAPVVLVGRDARNPVVATHLAAGGRAVVVHSDPEPMLALCDGTTSRALISIPDVPATLGGRVGFNVQNAQFAAAIAMALGIDIDAVREGLSTFEPDFERLPGRLNLCDRHPFLVVMDYGHNAAAIRAACAAAARMGAHGRRICVLAVPGDRRDEDIREVARAVAGWADLYICRRDDDLRGRGPDEVPRLLRNALIATGIPADRVSVVPAEQEATLAALRAARPGDLVLLFADALDRTWNQVIGFRPGAAAAGHALVPVRKRSLQLA